MAKKISKSRKLVLSLIFHLIVLIGMVMLYDFSAKLVADYKTKEAKEERTVESPKENKGKVVDAKPNPKAGTTMADLMTQKTKKEMEKKAEAQKND